MTDIILRVALAVCLFSGAYTALYMWEDSYTYRSPVSALFGFIWGVGMGAIAQGALLGVVFGLIYIFTGSM